MSKLRNETFFKQFVALFKTHSFRNVFLFGSLMAFCTSLFIHGMVDYAKAASITVCPVGCDYISLTDAIADPGGAPLIITIKSDFVFDDAFEDDDLFLQADTTIQCEPGAVYGDAAQDDVQIWLGDDNTIQDCSFENVNFDTTFGNNVNFFNNDFSSAAAMSITLTGSDGFEISGNTGLQHLQIQAPMNGLIDDNNFECRFGTNCIGMFNDTPENITISNNVFTNYNVTQGEIVNLQKGINTVFTGNTLQSVTMNDVLIRMAKVSSDVYIANNYFIMPERPANPNSSTWAIEAFLTGDQIDLVAEHNTIVQSDSDSSNSNDAAIGLSDNGTFVNVPVNITAEYNLFYQAFDTTPIVRGFDLEYTVGSADLTLIDSFNGFYGVDVLVYDSTGTITSINANTVTSDPLLRTENVDTTDDYYPSPISRYFDVDGLLDIGAYADSRITNYLIDDDCIVDYITCFSNESRVLQHAISTSDTIEVAAGSYDSVVLDFPVSNVSLMGAGATTIFDAAGVGSGFTVENIDVSDFTDFTVQNSTAIVTESYEISHILYEYNSNTYDQSLAVTGFANAALLFTDASCGVILLTADDTDVTAVVDAAIDDWNVGLIETSGFKLTTIFPDRFISNASELTDYALNQCGATITVDLFIPSFFEVSGGDYTYNAADVASAGATLKPGLTDPPTLNHDVDSEEAAGIHINNSDGNTFSGITSTDNTYALLIAGTSDGNSIEESVLTNSDTGDLFVSGNGDTDLIDVDFDYSSSNITGAGETTVWFTAKAQVTSSSSPVENADVTFSAADLAFTQTLQTDVTGNTPYSNAFPSYILTQADTSGTLGGFNPYSVFVEATDYSDKLLSITLNQVQQNVSVILSRRGGGTHALEFPGPFSLTTTPEECTDSRTIQIEVEGKAFNFVTFSNDPNFSLSAWKEYISPSDQYTWTLTEGDGLKSVYARVRSGFGNISGLARVDILLDMEGQCEDIKEIEKDIEDKEDALEADQSVSKESELFVGDGQALIKPGSILKGIQDTVYYYGNDGKRHVFPDVGTYFSWYSSFNPVIHITQSVLEQIPLGENITYKPGSLIKFRSPNVYLVGIFSTLHHIMDENVASKIYGMDWAKKVRDVDDVFLTNYQMGKELVSMEDAQVDVLNKIDTIDVSQDFIGEAPAFVTDVISNSSTMKEEISLPVCPAAPFEVNLQFGSLGTEVNRLQILLHCLGYFPDNVQINSHFGPTTQSSLRKFQEEKGINPSGLLDGPTRAALKEETRSN